MTRTDFMKCTLGICSCAGLAVFQQEAAHAESGTLEIDELKRRLDAARKRFAILVRILNDNLDGPTRRKILENLGRECAKQYSSLTDKYKGNVNAFLDAIQRQWVEKAEYDEMAGTIRIVDKSKNCTCPLVDQSQTPADFCDCTLGWQKETYSAILGRSVEVALEESILRGGKRCVFRIQVLS